MNPVLEQILRTGQVAAADGTSYPLHSHVSQRQGQFLQDVVQQIGAIRSLEVGLAYGVSALFICDGLVKQERAHHIAIDPVQHSYWRDIGVHNLQQAGYGELFKLYQQQSHIALPQLLEAETQVDFAFIDGQHTFDFVLVDFFYIDHLLRVGGVVALDDTNMPSIRRVCRFIAANRNYRVLRCLPVTPAEQVKRRIINPWLYAARGTRSLLSKTVGPSDRALGLTPASRCIAFEKIDDDNRKWEFHRDF